MNHAGWQPDWARALASAALALALSLLACSDGSSGPSAGTTGTTSEAGPPAVRHVPDDHDTIQDAVDAANPGDLVLIGPGTYREQVVVDTERVVVRGTDRNAVVLDGRFELNNGITVTAGGVAVENLTVRGYVGNGVLVTGALDGRVLEGYRVSYVTAHANGTYGIYAISARGGIIEHSYASGSADSGIYVGQCKPCDTLVSDVVAERNAIGYFATNASGVVVVRSAFRHNRVGAAISSQAAEGLAPQVGSTFAGNLVADNDEPGAPGGERLSFGYGIVVGGGTENVVVRNRVAGNPAAGIEVSALREFVPSGNEVRDNVLAGNGTDLALAAPSPATLGNCFVANNPVTSSPPLIESAFPCDGAATDVDAPPLAALTSPAGVDPADVAEPPPQPSMPSAGTAPPAPATSAPPAVDVTTLVVPEPDFTPG